jgi:hypothetical protein
MKSTFIVEYNSFDRDIEMFNVGVTKTFDEDGLDHNRRTISHGQGIGNSSLPRSHTSWRIKRVTILFIICRINSQTFMRCEAFEDSKNDVQDIICCQIFED